MFTSRIHRLPLWCWALARCVALCRVLFPPRDLSPSGRVLMIGSQFTQYFPGSVLDGLGVSAVNLLFLVRSQVDAFIAHVVRSVDVDHVLHPFLIIEWTLGPFALPLLLMRSTTGLQYCGMEQSRLHVSAPHRGWPSNFWVLLTSRGVTKW